MFTMVNYATWVIWHILSNNLMESVLVFMQLKCKWNVCIQLCDISSFKYSNWPQVNNDIVLKEPIYKSVIWICIHVFSSDNRILTTRKNRWWFTTVLCFAFHFFLIDIFHWLHEMLTCQSRSNCNAKCPSI